jgi:hypothetical protein
MVEQKEEGRRRGKRRRVQELTLSFCPVLPLFVFSQLLSIVTNRASGQIPSSTLYPTVRTDTFPLNTRILTPVTSVRNLLSCSTCDSHYNILQYIGRAIRIHFSQNPARQCGPQSSVQAPSQEKHGRSVKAPN